MKNVIKLENDYYPKELRNRVAEFINFYKKNRYHELLGNVTPADVYFGRQKEVINRRKIKESTLKEGGLIRRPL